jgi:hypothetical protein
MSRQLFVWRMARGYPACVACEHTPGNRNTAHLYQEMSRPQQGSIDRTRALDAMFDELSHGRLRGGWGANPEFDGRLDEPIGVEHDRMACQHDSCSDPETSHAEGSRLVWCRLREMSAGDVVFLPKSPDDGHFMVTTVQRPDACDWATVVDEAEADGSHDGRPLIGVADTMRYAYGSGTLYPDLFEAPCREAIQRIPEDDPSYRSLEEFLRSWGR